MNKVLKTTRHVTKRIQQVTIDKQALVDFLRKLIEDGIEIPSWNYDYHFFDGGHKTVAYLLILDSINFCFWPNPGAEKWEVQYKSETLSGYYALAASLKKAIESGISITDAHYLSELNLSTLKQILGGKGELQLMEERIRILNELGAFLISRYNGEANRLVEAAENSTLKLVELLVDNLTAFADYKLPQVLRHVGVFQYSPSLEHKVDNNILLDPGSPEEIEIRANTIWAVELIRLQLKRMGRNLRAFEIDWILWNLGQQRKFKEKPYHRTVTIYY